MSATIISRDSADVRWLALVAAIAKQQRLIQYKFSMLMLSLHSVSAAVIYATYFYCIVLPCALAPSDCALNHEGERTKRDRVIYANSAATTAAADRSHLDTNSVISMR